MDVNKNYKLWKKYAQDFDNELKAEFNQLTPATIKTNFSKELTFGTAGLRGVLGVGSGCMNIYTIRRATMAYAQYLQIKYSPIELKQRGIVIGHDNRKWSALFAYESAAVLAKYGIRVKLFPNNEVTPTPVVSFAVREGNFVGGIVITASHNPKQYNGYKVYDDEGCQLLPDATDQIGNFYLGLSDEMFTFQLACKSTLITDLDQSIKKQYVKNVKSMEFYPGADKKIKIVFSNLHGSARNWTPVILKDLGYEVIIVEEQYDYDPNFTTCPFPNPEILSNYDLAISYAKKHDADLIILNDPDADRIGIGVKTTTGNYQLLTGNETAPIILEYWLSQKKKFKEMPSNPVMYNTFVTSDLSDKVAAKWGVKTTKTLTGFKWIGSRIPLEAQNHEHFVFGFEEAYGYVLNPMTRDKDGIQSSVVIAEACNYFFAHHQQTLVDVLTNLYHEFGYYYCHTYNHGYQSLDAPNAIQKILKDLRVKSISQLGPLNCIKVEDYLTSLYQMPPQNLLKFYFDNGSWMAVRASGTEPKIKFYYICVSQKSLADAVAQQKMMQNQIHKMFLTNT